MEYSTRSKGLYSFFVLIVLFSVCTKSFGFGTIVGTQQSLDVQNTLDGNSDNRRTTANIRSHRALEAKRQNGQGNAVANISELYVKMAETLNAHNRPAKKQIESNLSALHVPKTTLFSFDKNMLAKYYILAAWTKYFSGDLKAAQQAAVRAIKASPEIKDAQITMTSIAMLAGEKTVRAPRKRSAPKTRNTYQNYGNSTQGTDLLELDVKSIRTDMVNPEAPSKISAMQLNCLNSTTFTYTPGNESLCIMFWQLSDKDLASAVSSDPNDPSAAPVILKTPAIAPPPMPQNMQPQFFDEFGGGFEMQQNMNPHGNTATQKQDSTFLSNTEEFKQLFSKAFGIENVKFVAVNTDSFARKQIVVDKVIESAWPWAHVMAQDPKSRSTQFQDITVQHEEPLLLITSKDGTIKYAGPVAGLLTPLMFTKATGEELNAPASNAGASSNPAGAGNTSVAKTLMGMFSKPKPDNNNTSATNPTRVANPILARKQIPAQPKEMSMEDEYAASKLLENARGFIKISRKITTPKNGIGMCRQIIKDYPNTEYSEEARMLLREVPERFRKRYNLTDKELGL